MLKHAMMASFVLVHKFAFFLSGSARKIYIVGVRRLQLVRALKILTRKLRHASYFSLECTDFKNVIFENIHWAHSEDAEVKRPQNPK